MQGSLVFYPWFLSLLYLFIWMIFSVVFSGSLLTLFKCFKMCFISFDLIAMFIYINPNTWIDVCFWPQQGSYLLSKLNFSPFLQNCFSFCISLNFPLDSAVKNPPANAGDEGSIPGWRRSLGEGNANPLQYSCLGNPVDRGAWRATVHGVAKELDMT